MIENYLKEFTINPKAQRIAIKKNITLIKQEDKKYILKGRRALEKNIFQRFRFFNEVRVYSALNSKKSVFLNVPNAYIENETKGLLLQYIEVDTNKIIDIPQFIKSYRELQLIKIKKNIFLDFYNQIFSAYFYRICIVSLFTISKKVNMRIALRIMKLYTELSLDKNKLKNKYWIHGDLHGNNYFKDENSKLYFIDFENMFYTRRWPLSEIISKDFEYLEGKVNFSSKHLQAYLNILDKNNEINKKTLFLECRFALLHHSIHEIVQTKSFLKRQCYIALLKVCLDKKKFNNWYELHIERQLIEDYSKTNIHHT